MNKFPLLVAFLTSSPVIMAQAVVHIPRIAADTDGNQVTSYPFGKTQFRSQIILEQSTIAANSALLISLEFRPENDNSTGMASVTLPQVQVELSHTIIRPNQMSTTFAYNRAGPATVVYSGPLTLPAYTSSELGVAPWISIPLNPMFSYDPTQGNLLVEIVATDPSGSLSTGYMLDAHTQGGVVRPFGRAGVTANPLPDQVRVSSSHGSQGLVPGGDLTASAGGFFSSAPNGLFLLGLAPYLSGIELGALGFTGSTLYVNPLFSAAIAPSGPMANWVATYAIPNQTSLVGARLYTQSFVQDVQAPGGYVTTAAQQTTIGEALMQSNQLRSDDPTVASGMLDKTTGGGPVMRLGGLWFN